MASPVPVPVDKPLLAVLRGVDAESTQREELAQTVPCRVIVIDEQHIDRSHRANPFVIGTGSSGCLENPENRAHSARIDWFAVPASKARGSPRSIPPS